MYVCFNPCFNGFFSSIVSKNKSKDTTQFVSILVLMDSSLQYKKPARQPCPCFVSILVLMDSSLQFEKRKAELSDEGSFNPCFNGFFSSIWSMAR